MTPGVLLIIAAALSVAMAFAWLTQRRTGNSGWVDTIWSAATGLAAIAAIFFSNGDISRQWLGGVAIALWSLRLASHIGSRSKGAAEDPRYAVLAEEWRDRLPSRLFWFLQIQALASFILICSVQAAVAVTGPAGAISDIVFLIIAVSALLGEAVSDRQLTTFRKENAGRKAICETRLWRFTRHPNYFFEWLFWCSWPLMAFGGNPVSPTLIAIALLAPILMYWLLVHISGIPPLEAHMLRSRGSAFEAYQHRVNAFFPGPRHNPNVQEKVQ